MEITLMLEKVQVTARFLLGVLNAVLSGIAFHFRGKLGSFFKVNVNIKSFFSLCRTLYDR